jgi:hypothetical protein
MGQIEKRLERLEEMLTPIAEKEAVEIHIIEQDFSKDGDGQERLFMVIKSGTPKRPGRTYHREETETEETFLERIKTAELHG